MPFDFLQKRFAALQRCDYQAVYDSYHPDAPFLQNFSGSDEYVCFAEQQLSQMSVLQWQCLRQRSLTNGDMECILLMELDIQDHSQLFFEMALLRQIADRWFYHSAQKLSPEDYPGDPQQLDFKHFDLVTEKIRF